MAQVDFSNAVLTPLNQSGRLPLAYDYLGLRNSWFFNSSATQINTGNTFNILSESYNTFSLVYTGSFTTSGTEFYIGDAYTRVWKVSNISFQNGDTYSFSIDIKVEGNT